MKKPKEKNLSSNIGANMKIALLWCFQLNKIQQCYANTTRFPYIAQSISEADASYDGCISFTVENMKEHQAN